MSWTCPECGRSFGAKGRSHMCAPGPTVESYLADAHPATGPIHERLVAHFETIGADEVIVDPVHAGIMYKRSAMFAMLRSMSKWAALDLSVQRQLPTNRTSRKVQQYGRKFGHRFNLADPAELDDQLLEWVTEAYVGHPPDDVMADPSWDPMVPDDVDLF